jgi:hypothetical protein
MWHSDNEEVGVVLLGNKAQPLVKGYHLILAIERNLGAAYGFAELNKGGDDPVINTNLEQTKIAP